MVDFIKNKNLETLGLVVLLAFLYFITGIFSLELLNGVNIVNLGIFAPEGIALAFALYFGKRVIPGIFIGQFILAYSNDVNIFAIFEISLINSLEAFLAIILFSKFKINNKLEHLRDVLALIIMIVFVLQTFSAFFGSMALLAHTPLVFSQLKDTLFSWWFGNLMAQILITPFLLLFFTHYKKIDFFNYFLYALVYGLYSCSLELFIGNPFLLLALNIPIIIYISEYKGIIYGALMSVILALVTSCSIYVGINIFQSNSMSENIINYNLFVLVHAVIILVVGILFEEKKAYENGLEEKIESEVNKNKEQQLMMLQQSRLAQMGEMISMIAHQWRQPLNNLSLVNQLLISKYKKGKLNDDNVDYFKVNSKKQIELMSTTIDDFRDFFKTEKLKKEFNVLETIENILEITKPIYANSAVRIELDVDGDKNYKTVGFPNALAQAILNIINNAKDALNEHKNDADKEIIISLYKQDSEIIIEILDNAGGIATDIIDNIFDPYFSTKQEKNGTGLGLYMSKMIIEEQLDAKLEVCNELYGAKFTIYLKEKNEANQ